jgi:hypothetical protein
MLQRHRIVGRVVRATRTSFGTAFVGLLAAAAAFAQLETGSFYDPQDDNRFGAALANVGDVNGDGIDDLVVGMPFYDRGTVSSAGKIVVIDGATGATIRSHAGSYSGMSLGWAVCGVGDQDGDGFADYAASAPFYDSSTGANVGEISVFSGGTGVLLWRFSGAVAGTKLGMTLDSLPDLDGDGLDEIVTGLRHLDRVEIYAANGVLFDTITGASGDEFGKCVARCGDLDGDHVDDFVVGEPGYDGVVKLFPNVGRVRVYSSSAHLPLLYDVDGVHGGDRFGDSVARCGDLDGDKIRDFLVGAVYDDTNGTNSGFARVVSGADGTTIHEVYGDSTGDFLGYALTGLRDFDDDGRADFAVSAPTGGSNGLGLVRVYSGLDAHVLWEWEGATTHTKQSFELGFTLASGDWNGDGLGDLALGDPLQSLYLSGTGWVRTGGVYTYVACPAWWKNYGAGWPGKYGVPTLTAAQDPEVGAPIDILVDNSHAQDTQALMFVGLSATDIPTNAGGHLLVVPLFSFGFPLPAAGLTLSDTLPNDPALYFADVFLQVIEVDPFASKGLSFTQGLQLHLGFDQT